MVKAEMQNLDGSYTLETTPTSATKGTIKITTKIPTANNVIVFVSNGSQTIMTAIAVSIKPGFSENTITVATPGTLSKLLADYDKTTITELTVIGNLNKSDISTLKNLPNLAILDMENVNLEELPSSAFYEKTSLTSVKLPRTLTTIGDRAFYGCSSLTSITIPDSVTSIGDSAFNRCSGLTSITIPDGVTTIGNSAFYGCTNLTSLTIGSGVTTIENSAFGGCSSLTSITIPDGVTTIEYNTFGYCSSLTSITIPDGVTSIGGSAFCYCSDLKSVTIGNSVTEIGSQAFISCSSLTSIYCKAQTPPTITLLSDFSWNKCALYAPIGCKEAYAAAAYWKNAKEIIEMEF